jgi:hypothetical protein
MTKVKLNFESCRECPFFESKPQYTADSFERPEDWFCTHEKVVDKDGNPKKIAGYVEWYDNIPLPDWCPIKEE